MIKSVPKGLNRESAYAARNETTIAIETDKNEIKRLLISVGQKLARLNRSAKLASVGENSHFGGVASRSFFVLNAESIIHKTGKK